MLSEYLAPRSGEGVTSAAIEAAIEALIETLRPHLEVDGSLLADDGSTAEPPDGGSSRRRFRHEFPSGGGGASLDLLRDLPSDRPDGETRDRLLAIVVPQPDPRQARDLEIALMHRGIYFQEGTLV